MKKLVIGNIGDGEVDNLQMMYYELFTFMKFKFLGRLQIYCVSKGCHQITLCLIVASIYIECAYFI